MPDQPPFWLRYAQGLAGGVVVLVLIQGVGMVAGPLAEILAWIVAGWLGCGLALSLWLWVRHPVPWRQTMLAMMLSAILVVGWPLILLERLGDGIGGAVRRRRRS